MGRKMWVAGASVASLVLAALGAPAAGADTGRPPGPVLVKPRGVPQMASPTARHGLSDVSVLSADDAWAVGAHTIHGLRFAWTRHWDGTGWTHVPAPSPGTLDNLLNSVVAISPSDVWAVGTMKNQGDSDDSQLVEHWDGSTWSVVSPPAGAGRPSSVSASGADDVWVVGDRYNDPIAEHWDGTSWTGTHLAVPDVTPPYQVALILPYAVTALSPTNAWVVGIYDALDGQGGYLRQPLVEHWNGTRWKLVPFPYQHEWSYLLAVSASSPNDIWAVGLVESYKSDPFFAHWAGRTWTATSTSSGNNDSRLSSVTAISSNDAWAVGTHNGHALAEHWDGQQWSISDGVDLGMRYSGLSAVDAVASNDVFAVGIRAVHQKIRGFTENWDGTSWHQQP